MSAYLVLNVSVHDETGYSTYRDATPPIIEAYGGQFLVRGGQIKVLEGDPEIARLVIVEFATTEAAAKFYESADYQRVIRHRTDNADTTAFIVKGVSVA